MKEKAEKKDAIAWGKEVDGLQAGLPRKQHLPAGRKAQVYRQAAERGQGRGFGHVRRRSGNRAQVTTDTGGQISVYMPPPFDDLALPTKRVLKPGETITLYNPEVAVESEDREAERG